MGVVVVDDYRISERRFSPDRAPDPPPVEIAHSQ